MSDEIPIPDSAFEPKPWFPDRESADKVVAEIKAFVSRTGKPYLWRGHTHTKPPEGATVAYIGELDLPASHRREDLWSPCPCCRPRHPKFCNGAKVGWFQEERVIRILGPHCFATLNFQGHHDALTQFRKEQNEKRTVGYLLANLHLVPTARRVVLDAIPVAKAVDTVRHVLSERLDPLLGVHLWANVKDGVLRVNVERTEVFRRPDQTEDTRVVHDQETYGPLPGYLMLRPRTPQFGCKLERIAEVLHALELGPDYKSSVTRMSDKERKHAASMLGNSLSKATRAFDEIEDIRRFTSAVSVATLNGWGKHPGSPVAIHIRYDGRSLMIGKSPLELRTMPLPEQYSAPLGRLPKIGTPAQFEVA